jgi:hypothetical protein
MADQAIKTIEAIEIAAVIVSVAGVMGSGAARVAYVVGIAAALVVVRVDPSQPQV